MAPASLRHLLLLLVVVALVGRWSVVTAVKIDSNVLASEVEFEMAQKEGGEEQREALNLDLDLEVEEESRSMLRRQDVDMINYEQEHEWMKLVGSRPQSTLTSKLAYHTGEGLRKLVGSNCVRIERGTVTPYYMCVGCKAEEAMGCIEDMRQNKSGNVRGACKFNHVMEGNMDHAMEQRQQIACCPDVNSLGILARFQGSAYPEAFRCLDNVGCLESTMYAQLAEECHGLCDFLPPEGDDDTLTGTYSGGTICLADYAAAPRSVSLSIASTLMVVVVASFWLVGA